MRPLVGFVANPNAARHGRHPHSLKAYEELLGDRGGLLRETGGTGDLSAVAGEFLGAGIDVLAIAGGDGTLHAVLNAFCPVYGSSQLPPILIVKAGTINNMSSEIGMSRSGLKILTELLDGEEAKPFRQTRRMLMRVNDGYGFLYGSGFSARLLKRYYQGPRQGPIWALLLVARSIIYAALRPEMAKDLFGRLEARITVEGNTRELKNLIFILASTILKIGLNFRPCPLALSSERVFHLLACSSPLGKLVSKVHRIYLGKPLDVVGCFNALASEVCIEFDRPLPYMVDGELKDEEKTHMIRRDRAVSFIADLES